MGKLSIARKIVSLSVAGIVFWACIQVTLLLGVEKKSFFVIFIDILGGGTVGASIGLAFFLFFGAVGWVSGALYGAFGLISLMIGGAFGGFGLGALIHIARNPNHYTFNIPVIATCLIVTCLLVLWVYFRVGRLYDDHGPTLAQWFIENLGK